MAQAASFNPGSSNPSTPYLDQNLAWFDHRLAAGQAQGNLTPGEASIVQQEINQFQQGLTDGQPVNRRQEWQEARQINHTIFDLRHNDLGTMGPGGPDAKCPHLRGPWNSSPPCGGSNQCSAQPTAPQPAPAPPPPPPPAPNAPNEGGQNSLSGVSVWGDPHIKDQNGSQTDFSQPNGLFLEQGPNGQQQEVMVSAPAANQVANSVQVLAAGQQALPTDPGQTEVYTDQNGQIVDAGTAASLGFTGGGASGQQVTAGAPVTLSDGTTVSFDGNGNVNFGTA
jgi:hypothetical protein